MADIDRIPSELEVGVFSDNLLSTQLDTQERIKALYSDDFNVPDIQHSMVPKHWNTDDILKSGELPSATDYLNSNDPKIREIGKNLLSEDSYKNTALTKGVGLPSMVRYQEGQEKFTDDHWFSGKDKTKFGFNPYVSMPENEDFYWHNVWDNYSGAGKLWRTVGKFAGRTVSKLVTGLVGMVGDLGSMAWNGLQEIAEATGVGPKNNFWADVSDNWLARTMEEADQYVKNQILPTYKNINYDDKGAFSKLTDPYFWMNDMADGAGFLLQFAIPGTLFGKAARLGAAGKLERFGKVMSAGIGTADTASKLSRGIGTTVEFLTGSRNVGGITAHAFNTTMEAVAETKEGFKETVKNLIEKGYSKREAEQMAAENAPYQFGMNMAILSFSNAMENRWFQKWAGNTFNPTRSSTDAAARIATKPGTWVGKFFADNKWGNRIYYYGREGAKAVMAEGYWEENAQLAAQRVAAGSYMRRGEDTSDSGKLDKATAFWKQLIKQTYNAATNKDREAADSIMAGAVIGILGSAGFAKFSGSRNIPQITADGTPLIETTGENKGQRVTKRSFLPEGARKQQKRDNAELVAQVRNAQDAWLNINVMPQDMFNDDGTINEEKAKARIDEINIKLAKVTSVFHRRMGMEQITDQTERQKLQYLLFGDYVKAHIMNGSGDALVNRLKTWGNKTQEELAMYGVTPEVAANPVQWATVAQNMLNEYKNIDKIRYENNTNETVDGYFQKERALKSLIFDYIAEKQAAQTIANDYAEKEATADPFKSVDTFNSYNKLVMRREVLEHTLKSPDLDEATKARYQKDLDDTNQQIEDRKKSLPEHQKGENSAMVFEVGSDVKAQEIDVFKTLNEYMEYQYAKEDFQRMADNRDQLVKDYSDPKEGLDKWNKVVEFWEKRSRMAKLKSLGWAEAEIVEMSDEQQTKLLTEGKKKEEEKPETEDQKKLKELNEKLDKLQAQFVANGKTEAEADSLALASITEEERQFLRDVVIEKKEEPKEQTFEEVKALAIKAIQAIDPSKTLEQIEAGLDAMVNWVVQKSIDEPDSITEATLLILTKYVQMKAAQAKDASSGQSTEESKQQTEDPVATGVEDAVITETQTGDVVPIPTEPDKGIKDADRPFILFDETSATNGSTKARSPEDIEKLKNALPQTFSQIMPDGTSQKMTLVAVTPIMGNWRITYRYPNGSDENIPLDHDTQVLGKNASEIVFQLAKGFTVLHPELTDKMFSNMVDAKVDQQIESESNPVNAAVETLVAGVSTDVPSENEVPKTILDEVKEAYRLHEKALENDTKFKEEAEKEGMRIHNNRIDEHSDNSKRRGEIGITTSNPKELKDGKLDTDKNNLARHNFLNHLMDGTLQMEDYKMVLGLGKKDGLFGIIHRANGSPVNFGEDGMPSPSGKPIFFYLDYDMFSKENLAKRRSDVVKPPFPLAPLATRISPITGTTDKTGEIHLGNVPISLHPSFEGADVIALIKENIHRKVVTASLTLLTSGLLYRDGVTNGYATIPKGEPTHTASELWGKGHLREEKGNIPLEDMEINGVYRRAHRIQFPLLREIGNPEAGAELAEFHPVSIGELKNESGEKIFDTLKTPDGKNFFQAAIEGNLEANRENLATLSSLLRPDKFMVMNLGRSGEGVVMVINLKKFKKFLKSDNITSDELRALTTLDDIKNSELNFTKTHYDSDNEVEMIPGVLGKGRDNYVRFVNNNVMTSAEPLKKGATEGYSRINKRIALTLDKTMDDMIKAVNQKAQENKAPEVTEVSEGDELEEKEKKNIVTKAPEEDENLEDDFTKTECP